MRAEKQVLEAVERAQAILARYVEPGERDCGRTVNDLLDVLDCDELVAAVEELEARGEAATNSGAFWIEVHPRGALPLQIPPSPTSRHHAAGHRGDGPEGRKAAYVPLSRDGKVVDSSAVVEKLKDCQER